MSGPRTRSARRVLVLLALTPLLSGVVQECPGRRAVRLLAQGALFPSVFHPLVASIQSGVRVGSSTASVDETNDPCNTPSLCPRAELEDVAHEGAVVTAEAYPALQFTLIGFPYRFLKLYTAASIQGSAPLQDPVEADVEASGSFDVSAPESAPIRVSVEVTEHGPGVAAPVASGLTVQCGSDPPVDVMEFSEIALPAGLTTCAFAASLSASFAAVGRHAAELAMTVGPIGGCGSNDQCPLVVGGLGVPAQEGSGEFCASDGRCIEGQPGDGPCDSDEQCVGLCKQDRTCSNGAIDDDCEVDSDCQDRFFCDGVSGTCEEESECSPIQQLDCPPNHKCTYVSLVGTVCRLEGNVGRNVTCSFDAEGVDDCRIGDFCHASRCTGICDALAAITCPGLCDTNVLAFSDVREADVGACLCFGQPCGDVGDPCEEDDDCYPTLVCPADVCELP